MWPFQVQGMVQYVPVVLRPATRDAQVETAQQDPEFIVSSATSPEAPGVSDTLQIVASHVRLHFSHLQTRFLKWGRREESSALDITRSKSDLPPEKGGPSTIASVRILHSGEGQVVIAGQVQTSTQVFECHSEQPKIINWFAVRSLLDNLGNDYVFCGGIRKEEYNAVCSSIRYDTTCLKELSHPFPRLVSKKCLTWYKLRDNATNEEKEAVLLGDNRCRECNTSYRIARKINTRNLQTLSHRESRVQARSCYKISLLSPTSKKRRLENITKEKKNRSVKLRRVLETVQTYTVDLSEEQSEQLSQFVQQIPADQLQSAFRAAAEEAGEDTADTLRKAFEVDQEKNSKSNLAQ